MEKCLEGFLKNSLENVLAVLGHGWSLLRMFWMILNMLIMPGKQLRWAGWGWSKKH